MFTINMTMRGVLAAMLLAGTAGAAMAQQPVASISVTAWAAPNAFGSPSFAGAESNALQALRTNTTAAGTPGTPTYYQAISSPVSFGNVIATNFNSWKGDANPTASFGAAFGQELGNRIHYALRIDGNGGQFSISQLTFATDSNDTGGYFDVDFGTGYAYSNAYVGLLRGADGLLFTSDDIEVTSGADTQLVDGLIGRGSGMADAVTCGTAPEDSGPCVGGSAAYQGYINERIAFYQTEGFSALTGTYQLLNPAGSSVASGSTTVNFIGAAVPEPATWGTMILGFALAGAALRRRRTAVAA